MRDNRLDDMGGLPAMADNRGLEIKTSKGFALLKHSVL